MSAGDPSYPDLVLSILRGIQRISGDARLSKEQRVEALEVIQASILAQKIALGIALESERPSLRSQRKP